MHCILITLIFLVPVLSAQTPTFDADQSFADLEKQCSFGPRNPGSTGYYECLDWLVETLKVYSGDVILQNFDEIDPISGEEYRLTNIIARFGGEGMFPLMLCAHWDSRPWANMDPDSANHRSPIIGANDGASGVAVLLEMARIFADSPPPRTVMITLFDGEDLGRSHYADEFARGSKYWAQHPIPEKPVEAILLDMIGDADLEIPIEPFSERGAQGLRRQLWDIAANLEINAFSDRYGSPVQDDHVPLLNIGIRAVDLIDFDYPHWHTMEDTPDKCSSESLDQVGRVLVEFIYGQ